MTWDEGSPDIPLIDSISKQARLKARSFEHIHLCVRETDSSWSLPHVVKGMEVWCRNITEEIFYGSSVIEQFVWVYSLHMVHGFGGLKAADWCEAAVTETVLWLRTLRYVSSLFRALSILILRI